ncbi:MAG: thioredoxin family protein, partial [Curvibacter sp.]
PAAGNPDGTLVNALLHHCKGQLSGIGGVARPGIVHRIDKDTSGLLLAAGAWSVWALGPYMFLNPAPQAQAADARWQAWSPARQQELLAAGKTVFVDYTAAWCVTCQYNKQTTLADPAVLAEFEARQVVLLRADWTRRDPAITAALGQLGRNGVPVYVFYRAGHAPLVLSEVLSTGEVRQALRSL